MNAIQTALARGLAVLASPTFGNGESFRVHGATPTFSAVLTSQIVPDGIGGRIMETIICAHRSAFSSLPREGSVIYHDGSSETYRVVECRPLAGGYINIVVRSALAEADETPAVLTWDSAGLTWETAGATW